MEKITELKEILESQERLRKHKTDFYMKLLTNP
jgi:hypothetical protein